MYGCKLSSLTSYILASSYVSNAFILVIYSTNLCKELMLMPLVWGNLCCRCRLSLLCVHRSFSTFSLMKSSISFSKLFLIMLQLRSRYVSIIIINLATQQTTKLYIEALQKATLQSQLIACCCCCGCNYSHTVQLQLIDSNLL